MAASLVKQQWTHPGTGEPVHYCQDYSSAGRYWAEVITEVRKQSLTVQGRYMEVVYEDLVNEPERVMREI